METKKIPVSYRDKELKKNISLGEIDTPRFASVSEALEYFDAEEAGKGEETCLEYIHAALDVYLQGQYREANRPDREKKQSNISKFKQLSPELQIEALRRAGIEV